MSARFIKAASLATAAFLSVGCASISTPPTYGLDSDSAAVIRQTCNDIMGLKVGAEFEACGGSLANTVRFIQDAHLTARADTACEQQGHAPGTPELAKCVVTFRRANDLTPTSLTMPSSADTRSWTPYFSMSDAQRAERAELSCAQMGLHPSWNSFSYCVSDLRHSILNVREWAMH